MIQDVVGDDGMVSTGDGPFTTMGASGGASEEWSDVLDEVGDTDTVYTTTPEDRPGEDPQDDPGNASDDGESVNVTDPVVEDPVDSYDDGQEVPEDVRQPDQSPSNQSAVADVLGSGGLAGGVGELSRVEMAAAAVAVAAVGYAVVGWS